MTGAWVALFSGGKDSAWALYQALERGLPVERLVTVHPEGDSYLYHVPATDLAELAARSIDIPLVSVRPEDFEGGDGDDHDASSRGDRELEPLEAALRDLDGELPDGIAGLTVGAIESEYQHSRIGAMADRLDVDVFAPLWQRDPVALGREMLDAGFDIRILSVSAGGLDESWVGRRLDAAALADLETLAETHGVHPLGEGGEFETLVVDGPHMARPIDLDYTVEWDGVRGQIRVADARLGAPDP